MNQIRYKYHNALFNVAYWLHCKFGAAAVHHDTKRETAILDDLNPRRNLTEIR